MNASNNSEGANNNDSNPTIASNNNNAPSNNNNATNHSNNGTNHNTNQVTAAAPTMKYNNNNNFYHNPPPPNNNNSFNRMYHQPPHMQFGDSPLQHMQRTSNINNNNSSNNNLNNSNNNNNNNNFNQNSNSNNSQNNNQNSNTSTNNENNNNINSNKPAIKQEVKTENNTTTPHNYNDNNNNPENQQPNNNSHHHTENNNITENGHDDKDKKPISTEQKKLYQSVLISLFEKNKYPTSHELEQAADETGQPLKKIRGWFQSQRNKERKKQGLVGSGKRLSEAEEAALKASVKNEANLDEMNTSENSMNKAYDALSFPSPVDNNNDINNPEAAPKPTNSPKIPKKQAAKRKSSKDKDSNNSTNNKTSNNNNNNITSMQNTGMINSMNPRFPMHHVPPGFFGQRQMQYQGYPPHHHHHPPPTNQRGFNRPFDQNAQSNTTPQGLQTCPPQIGARPAFTFPSTSAQSSNNNNKNLDEDSNFESGRSSSYHRSSDDMDVAYSSKKERDADTNGDYNGFSIFRSISVADPMGLGSLSFSQFTDHESKEEKSTTTTTTAVENSNDPLDMRNIICHDSRENILDLNAIDSYYDKHT